MSLRSALYSCWDIFQKNCQHAIGVATIATNPITAKFIPAIIKGFLVNEQALQENSPTPSSEGLYETYIIGTYSDNTRLPKHYQHKHDATQDKGDKYQIKVGLTHVEDKVVAAVVGLPLALLESIWFLLQALVCGLLLLGTTVLLPIVPLILLFSMQPSWAFASFFALLQVEGGLFLALLYNLAHAPFRLLKAAAKILALPWVGLSALLDWSDDHLINPETMQEQQKSNPIMESQSIESSLEKTIERETWFVQEENQYHFILGDINWDQLPDLVQKIINLFPNAKGATVTLTVTDLKPGTESSLATWLPDLGKLFQLIKEESKKQNPDYSQFIGSLIDFSKNPKLSSIIAQLTDGDQKIRVQDLRTILEKLASMANMGLQLSIKDQDGNIVREIPIADLTPENLFTLLAPVLKSADENGITAEWIANTFLNSLQNPQALQENLVNLLIQSALPKNMQTPEAKNLLKTALTFGQSVFSQSIKTPPRTNTESPYKPKEKPEEKTDTPLITSQHN